MKKQNKNDPHLFMVSIVTIVLILTALFISLPLAEKSIAGLTNMVPTDLSKEIKDVQKTVSNGEDLTNVILFEKDTLGDVFSYFSTVMAVLALLVSAIGVVITYIFSKSVQNSTQVATNIAHNAHILSTEALLQQTLKGTLTAFDEIERLYNYGTQFLQLSFHVPFNTYESSKRSNELRTYLMYYFADYRNDLETIDLRKRKICITGHTLETYFNLKEPIEEISVKDLVLTMPYFLQFYQKNMNFQKLVNEEVFFKDKPEKKYRFVIKYVELTNKMIDKVADFIETNILTKDVDFSLQVELAKFKLQDVAEFKSSYQAFKSNTSSDLNLEDLSLIDDLTKLANNSLEIDSLRITRMANNRLDTLLKPIENGEVTADVQRDNLISQFDKYLLHDVPKIQMGILTSIKEITDNSKEIYMSKIDAQLMDRKSMFTDNIEQRS